MAETNKGIEEEVARAFVNHYYHLFDNDRSSLSTLYNPTSLLTFEGQKIYGVEDISNKLKQLPFDQCRHLISTVDSQPSSMAGGCGGILVFVSGSLQLHGEDHPLRFSQTFHLIPLLQGSFFVQNEMFRLNYGQEALLGKKVLPLCHIECMPICMKVTEATQEVCDGACQAGCLQLQGPGTDQGVDMVIA